MMALLNHLACGGALSREPPHRPGMHAQSASPLRPPPPATVAGDAAAAGAHGHGAVRVEGREAGQHLRAGRCVGRAGGRRLAPVPLQSRGWWGAALMRGQPLHTLLGRQRHSCAPRACAGPKGEGGLDDATGGNGQPKQTSTVVDLSEWQRGGCGKHVASMWQACHAVRVRQAEHLPARPLHSAMLGPAAHACALLAPPPPSLPCPFLSPRSTSE